jgi:hypothetical protein
MHGEKTNIKLFNSIQYFNGNSTVYWRDKVYQLLAHDRWFSPGTPASSTTKTGRHE